MSHGLRDYIYIFGSIGLTVFSQVIMKWQVNLSGAMPDTWPGRTAFIVDMLLKPWVLTAMIATFLGGVTWMMALTRFSLSQAFPWTSLSFFLILLASWLLLEEPITAHKLLGNLLIMAGVIVISRG